MLPGMRTGEESCTEKEKRNQPHLVAAWHVRHTLSSVRGKKKKRLNSAGLAWSLGLRKMKFTMMTVCPCSWCS